jgi:hypothetical protein
VQWQIGRFAARTLAGAISAAAGDAAFSSVLQIMQREKGLAS